MRCFLGGTSKLLKAIVSHASLRTACNVLTPPYLQDACQSLSPKSPCKPRPYSLPKFPFRHQLQTRAPLRNTPPPPLPGLKLRHPACPERSRGLPKYSRSKVLSSRPEQRRSLPLRSGGTTATNQPFRDSIYQTLPTRSPPSPIHFSYPSHSFFLLWKFLFPFDASFPLALPLDC